MTLKASGRASEWRVIDEWDGGGGWLAYPDEAMQRASHVLDGADGVWLVDPVDFDGLDDYLAERGEVTGVVLLLDRHKRDASEIAARHDVSVHVPAFMDDVPDELDAPAELLEDGLPDTEYRLVKLIDNPVWKEAVLFDESSGTLVVPEAVGTTPYFRTTSERLGVHPALRLKPPRSLRQFAPERVLVGHGEGVLADAGEALVSALSGSRKRAPRLYAENVGDFLL